MDKSGSNAGVRLTDEQAAPPSSPSSFDEWEWFWQKPRTYCRQHGKRIVGYLNGFPLCESCL